LTLSIVDPGAKPDDRRDQRIGEEFFQHALVFDRSSRTRWRQRIRADKLKALFRRQSMRGSGRWL